MTEIQYKEGDRVLVSNKYLGTVYQDSFDTQVVVHVTLDDKPNTVDGYYKHQVTPVPAEHEDYLKGHLSVLVIEDVSQELFDLLSGNPWRDIYKDAVPNPEDTAVKAKPIIDVDETLTKKEEPFRYKEGDRVKLKYNRNTGTVLRDEVPIHGVLVAWDHAKPGSEKASEGVKGGKDLWEKPEDLTVLHAPRATDPANPDQELIDQLEALRLPIKARIEKDQAILSKLTAAQKILKKG